MRAWLRCQPVVAHNSSKLTHLPALSARSYRVAFALVTARRWLTVSPHRSGLSAPANPAQ